MNTLVSGQTLHDLLLFPLHRVLGQEVIDQIMVSMKVARSIVGVVDLWC